VLQRHAIEKLHDNECLAGLLTDIVYRANVGVIECRGSFGLSTKTAQCLRIVGDFIREELQGYEAVQSRILGLVNHTHPPSTQLFQDAVMRDGLADQLRRPSLTG